MTATETVVLRCPCCENIWSIQCPIEIQDGEEVVVIGVWDDLCPIEGCGAQGEMTIPVED